jgi:hypothetical protein
MRVVALGFDLVERVGCAIALGTDPPEKAAQTHNPAIGRAGLLATRCEVRLHILRGDRLQWTVEDHRGGGEVVTVGIKRIGCQVPPVTAVG